MSNVIYWKFIPLQGWDLGFPNHILWNHIFICERCNQPLNTCYIVKHKCYLQPIVEEHLGNDAKSHTYLQVI